jgi:hypothetical protein
MSSTSSTTTPVRTLRAHGLQQAAQVLRCLLRAPPSRHPEHQALRQIVRVASASSTPASVVVAFSTDPSDDGAWWCCARSSELHQHPLHVRVSWRPSLQIPQTTAPGGAPSLARPVFATPVCVCVCHRPEAFLSVANLRMSRPSTPDCIEFRIYPLFDCLNASSSSSLVASPSRHRPHDASSARGFLCGCLPSTTSTAQHRPQLH